MKKIMLLVISLCLSISITGCSANQAISELQRASEQEEPASSASETSVTGNGSEEGRRMEQSVYTIPVPPEYFEEAQQQGQVITVQYETSDYTASQEARIEKPALVYLPYGYDEDDTTARYNILYLMHGWGMTANDFFNDGQSDLVNILDNMIEQGDIPPLIVVSASFDAENSPQSFSRSTEEIAAFHQELRNDLIPAIESQFRTYAQDITEDQLQASRAHRAFAGFSLGAVTTWYEFVYNLDYIQYFAPMSGDCWILGTYGGLNQPEETVEYLEGIVQDGGWNSNDFLVYSGIGTDDPLWNQVSSQMQAMRSSAVFTSDNLIDAIKENGRHDIDACEEYLYNALPNFFSSES